MTASGFRVVSSLKLVIGVASIVVGCLTIAFSMPNTGWPAASGVGIWGALNAIIAGICGVAEGVPNRSQSCNRLCLTAILDSGARKNGPMFRHYFINCFLTMIFTSQMVGYSIHLLANCASNPVGAAYCISNRVAMLTLSILGIVIGCSLFALAVIGAVCCKKWSSPIIPEQKNGYGIKVVG